MKLRGRKFHTIDLAITRWMSAKGLVLLRLSIGIVFFWFGFLKYFEGLSPAEDIAVRTVSTMTFGLIDDRLILYGLATWEVLIGIGLIFKLFMRATLLLLYLQMLGTFMPIFLFPDEVFHLFPISFTLEGQYIIKNIVVLSAGIVIGATVRGGTLVPEVMEAN
jgi:uncharacterized membrane protein YkgB